MFGKLRNTLTQALSAVCVAIPLATAAADFPNKPVTIVVGNPPGGPTDAFARSLAQRLAEAWNQPVLVDNRPGASEIIATQAVVKAAPDGHVLLFCTESPLMLNQHIYAKLGYDPQKDLAAVSQIVSSPLTLVVPTSLPVRTIEEFVTLAKARSGTKPLIYGSAGTGGVLHLPMVSLAKQSNVELIHAPYRGAAPLMSDLVSGQINAGWVGVSGAVPFVRDGKLKALVVGGSTRLKALPDVPSIAESRVPPVRADFMFALMAPAATPAAVKDKISADIRRILSDPMFREKNLEPFGYIAIGSSPAEFEQFLVKDRPLQAERIRLSGAKPE